MTKRAEARQSFPALSKVAMLAHLSTDALLLRAGGESELLVEAVVATLDAS